jgi:enoyl-CoA hydratase
MAEQVLLVEKSDHICTLTINRPKKVNSLTSEVLNCLVDTFEALKNDNEIRAVVIRGAGEKAFSAGYDISMLNMKPEEDERIFNRTIESILSYPYPVLAMIYGFAIAGGLGLAVACDLRLATDTARFGMTPAKLGVVYHHTGLKLFISLIGISKTKELFFTGRLIDAQRAKEIGLVDWVVPELELPKVTYNMAREITENAPLSVTATKITISKFLKRQELDSADEIELRQIRQKAASSEDLAEGKRAFMEKRKPVFKGL